MAEIVMPRLSDTMEEGTILRWLKGDGEEVKRGEELVEIETDKANMTYESDQEGVLETIAAEGDTLAVGEPIARVGASTGAAEGDVSPVPPSVAEQEEGPASGPAGVRAVGDAAEGGDSHEAGSSTRRSEGEASPAGERVRASPLARRIASESGVDLHAVRGSGPGGRIVKADVQAAGGEQTPSAGSPTEDGSTARDGNPTTATDATAADLGSPAEPTPAAGSTTAGAATAKGETTIVELTRTQQTIARRMAESKATIPDFTLQMDVDMEECVKLREELKRLSPEEAPTYNDMVVKACALALREHPRANGSYRDGRMQLHSRVNVGVAVAVDSGDGPAAGALVVPTVFDAGEKSLGEIARETRALAERVRDGTISPPELGGGTFTVSNLGMFGVSSFTAIVNPPQAAILSVGALAPRAVARAGDVVARNTMTVTLACDHRILYGADAARFLERVRELLEVPAALTL
jgi:pyruvate dehydrogenase E2 component (dihydrolipoamide acetyltransferase)